MGNIPLRYRRHKQNPGLNLAFLHQFLSLLSIMIPRWTSKETGLLLSHGMFLMLRTYLSLVVARLDGEIVRDLVAGNGRSFIWGIIKVSIFFLAVVSSFVWSHIWNGIKGKTVPSPGEHRFQRLYLPLPLVSRHGHGNID